MTPEVLYLKGFKGIRAGMGRDEIRIDLRTDVIGEASGQLVALTGGNGAGKTTIMDNLQPYRIMPSRASGTSVAGFSYYEHLCLPECIKELTFRNGGKRYRSTLVFRVNGVRKAEAYLHVEEGGQWRPVRLPDGTTSDGKTSTHDACVEWLAGKAETFFLSKFAAQGRKALSTYSAAEMKSVMVDLLGLERVKAAGEKASQVCKGIRSALEALRSKLRELGDTDERYENVSTALAAAEANVKSIEAKKAAQRLEIERIRTEVAGMEREFERQQETEKKREEVNERLAALKKRKVAIDQQVAHVRRSEGQRLDAARAAHRQVMMRLAKRRATVAEELAAAKTLLASRESIEAAVARVASLGEEENKLQQAICGLARREERRKESLDALGSLEKERTHVKERAGQAALWVEGLRKRLGLTAVVPCAGTDLQGRCQLLSDANEAKAMVPSGDVEIASLKAQYDAIGAQVATLRRALGEIEGSAADLDQARAALSQLQRERVAAAGLAARKETLNSAEGVIARCVQELSGISAEENDAKDGLEKQVASCEEAIGVGVKRAAGDIDEVEKGIAAAQAQLHALPAPPERGGLVEAQASLKSAIAQEALHEQAHRDHLLALAEAKGRREAAVEAAKEASNLRGVVKSVEDEVAWWNLLSKACSNDGVIALCIDDAGPELARLTNELLLACYGPRFTVSIVTQVETAKKELREGFDVTVFDAQTGDSKSVDVMSGGERVWINEALTRAIALYLASQQGASAGTIFTDEADGPLDSEHKRMFMAMKREVLRLGGYEREFYISQTPELAAMADAQLDVGAMRRKEEVTTHAEV